MDGGRVYAPHEQRTLHDCIRIADEVRHITGIDLERVVEAVGREREALAFRGFRGVPHGAPWVVVDHGHVLMVHAYSFPDGSRRLYVEAAEVHAGAYAARIWPLPEAVHLLQNVTEREFYSIGCRERDEAKEQTVKSEDEDLIELFDYEHLPEHLREVSKPFHDLAHQLYSALPLNHERVAALRKLREAKDCAVTAVVLHRKRQAVIAKARP